MGIDIGIEDGLIVVRQPGPAGRRSFPNEEDAIDLVAEMSCVEGIPVDFADSCDAPGANGREGFSKADFLDRLDDRICDIRASNAPRI